MAKTFWKNFITADGDIYTGETVGTENPLPSGFGIIRNPNGEIHYIGEWNNGEKSGFGFTFDSGLSFGKNGEKNYPGIITGLQMQTYLVITDFHRRVSKKGLQPLRNPPRGIRNSSNSEVTLV